MTRGALLALLDARARSLAAEPDRVHCCDALTLLRALPDASIDAVITDPPYPEVNRDYGKMTVAQWETLIHSVVRESRRVLKPSGSAMFVLQPNSAHVGEMRSWLWDFMSWCIRHWNVIQDVYWWNFTSPPTVHSHEKNGLMRPSVKYCVWVGNSDCYRNQDAVLWELSDSVKAIDFEDRALRTLPSGLTVRPGRIAETSFKRGGSTPFNLLPFANANSTTSGGAAGHGAATPDKLATWWINYITPPNGIVCDPFVGSGTIAIEAKRSGRHYICGDQSQEYVNIARDRLRLPFEPRHVTQETSLDGLPLFAALDPGA